MEQQKQTYTNPIEKIRKIYQTLSPIQKKIADLVLEQAETICFMRLEDIGRSVGVISAKLQPGILYAARFKTNSTLCGQPMMQFRLIY